MASRLKNLPVPLWRLSQHIQIFYFFTFVKYTWSGREMYEDVAAVM